MNDEEPAFFLNRAKCHKAGKDFEHMADDAKEAINRDPKYLKAFLTLGEALVELGKVDTESNKLCEDGLKHLKKAKSLCASNHRLFEAEVDNQLLKAKKISFFRQREIEDMQEAKVLTQMLTAL